MPTDRSRPGATTGGRPPAPPAQAQADRHLAARLPEVLRYHQKMLGDATRNRALRDAITAHVTPQTDFLDVGSGTGVWAILAAQLGARRVVAIEQDEALAAILHRQARENGVGDRIEIVRGNVDDVRLRGRFTLMVCELFGAGALGARTIGSFVGARDLFLAPGGVLIPQRITMVAAPTHTGGASATFPADLPVRASYLRRLLLNHPYDLSMTERAALEVVGAPAPLVEVDFRTIVAAPSLDDLRAEWTLDDVSRVDGVVLYNRHAFTDAHVIDSLASQSWGVALHRVEPFAAGPGTLHFSVSLRGPQPVWTVSASSDPGAGTRSYSPAFSLPAIRWAQRDAPVRTVKPRGRRAPGRRPDSANT